MKTVLLMITMVLAIFASEVTLEQLFNVKTVKVQQQQHAKHVKNFGFVRVDESRSYDVVPRFGGYIITLYADKRYQKVSKGQRLAKIYSPEVLQAKEDYLNAINYDKKRSNPQMVASAKEKLQLLGIAEGEINALKKSGKADQYSYIYAPTSGYIFEKGVSNRGSFTIKQKLFSIVNLDQVWVEAKIYQKDLAKYGAYTDFSIKATGVAGTFKANKEQLYPNMDPKESTATLRLVVQNPKQTLIPGMYVSVSASMQKEHYLTLPTTAVIRKNGQFYVFIVSEFEGEYEPIVVDVTPLNANIYIIKSGLSVGDEVVDNALFMMDSDAQINGLY